MGNGRMESLFRDFWWLMFPLAWIIGSAFSSFFRYRSQKNALDLVRTYVERGQEPPEALLRMVEKPHDPDAAMWEMTSEPSKPRAPRVAADYWSLFGLFAALAAGFGFAGAFTGIDRGSGAFLIVAVTMGAVAVWALINAVVRRGEKP